MQALVLDEPGCLSLREIQVPDPRPGEVLIRVQAATTCGTDLKAYLRGHPQIPMPGVFGHEYSGIVAAIGEGAPFEVGDAVMGVHSAPCRSCFWCRRGQENLCESIMSTKVLGSYAEYLLIPAHIARANLFHKPAELTFEIASLLEPLSCVAQGIELLNLRSDDRVLIIGPGSIGLMFVAALRLLGIESVTLAGRNRARLDVGERLGAMPSLLSDISGNFDLVIECTGNVEVWERSVDYSRRGGTVMLFGGCPSGTTASFDTKRLHYDQITLVSPFHFGTNAVRTARVWLIDHRMDLSPLISGTRSLDEGESTFEDLRQGRGLKYVFKP
ncbi:MAG: alcohol dehydrogenase catalytic domain-containing protein [Fimbriimonadaceae bacterium]|nr:alcohol dehydrogenase catalytic domain-containing protein [Fimbriimonadaceae bacterium]